jgi:thiol-disulfide isomerase/thioredoxin
MNPTAAFKWARKPIARFSCFVIALGVVTTASAAAATVGAPAPAFSLDQLDGKVINSTALKGKVVLLDFWASWCAPCIASMPAIAKLQRDYARKGLVVLGITLDDDSAKLKSFLARRSPGVMVVKPTPAFNRSYGALLHLKGDRIVTPDNLIQANLPTWILIDRKGRIAGIHPSSSQEKQMLGEAAALASRS